MEQQDRRGGPVDGERERSQKTGAGVRTRGCSQKRAMAAPTLSAPSCGAVWPPSPRQAHTHQLGRRWEEARGLSGRLLASRLALELLAERERGDPQYEAASHQAESYKFVPEKKHPEADEHQDEGREPT